jgi:uncharacterized membrane protein YbaN (DUF454 family)
VPPKPAIPRWLLLLAGTICAGIGVLTLPVPLFPSMAFGVVGLALIARGSERAQRWLRTRRWLPRALAHIRNARLQRWVKAALGLI